MKKSLKREARRRGGTFLLKLGVSAAVLALCGALLQYVTRPYRVARTEREANAILLAIIREQETSLYRDQWLEYAIQRLREARELDSMYQRTHLLLGAAYLLKGTPQIAMESYKAAEAVRRDHKLYTNMGFCYMQMGELKRAREYLELALSIAPDFPEAVDYLAELKKKETAR